MESGMTEVDGASKRRRVMNGKDDFEPGSGNISDAHSPEEKPCSSLEGRTGGEPEHQSDKGRAGTSRGDRDLEVEASSDDEEVWTLDRLMQTFESAEDMKIYIERTQDVGLLRFLAKLQGPRMERFSARKKLPDVNDIRDVTNLLNSCQKILVLTGAGVSVSAGIPDFRSADGIYSRLKREYDMPSPTCMFDKTYFNENPGPFFSFANELWPGRFEPTRSHLFIAELEKRGKLLRNYTQNIDTLEQRAGIKRVIACHGSFATATCVTCKKQVDGSLLADDIMAKRIARCPSCAICDPDGSPSYGVMKPDIVFFGEALPDLFYNSLEADLPQADLMLVIGTSLRVAPVSEILPQLPRHVPVVLINREVVGYPHDFDVELLGDSDAVVTHLLASLTKSPLSLSAAGPASDHPANFGGNSSTETSHVGASPLPGPSSGATEVMPVETTNLDEARDAVVSGSVVRWLRRPSTFLFPGFLPPPASRPSSRAASSRDDLSDGDGSSCGRMSPDGISTMASEIGPTGEGNCEGAAAAHSGSGGLGASSSRGVERGSGQHLAGGISGGDAHVSEGSAVAAGVISCGASGGYDESWGVQRPRPTTSIMKR